MELEEFFDSQLPEYGILSHRWDSKEMTLQDFQKPSKAIHPGYEKIKRFCQIIAELEINYAWVDTCCIDKTSSAELSESINSMFRWYQSANICIVYLADVDVQDLAGIPLGATEDELSIFSDDELSTLRHNLHERVSKSSWFTRGWTLQELLAPRSIRFYAAEWLCIGMSSALEDTIAARTGIEKQFLDGSNFETVSVAKRMSWASRRITTRIEDMAYCLLGIFNVNMPLLYGEGAKAFTRLQEEIMKDSADHSLLAWTISQSNESELVGPLATSPADFAHACNISPYPNLEGNPPYAMTNQGLRIDLPLHPHSCSTEPGLWMAILGCYNENIEEPLAIIIRPSNIPNFDNDRPMQCSRLVNYRAPVPVTPNILNQAKVGTIYIKKTPAWRFHGKKYTFHLRLQLYKDLESLSTPVKLYGIYPHGELLETKTSRELWHAYVVSDSPSVGVLFAVGGQEFLICLKVFYPEQYIHALDRWLRSRCRFELVSGPFEVPETIVSDLIRQLDKTADKNSKEAIFRNADFTSRLFATVGKEFESGSMVICVDFDKVWSL